MPTLYWGPWLAKIRRGGPDTMIGKNYLGVIELRTVKDTLPKTFI